MTRVRTDDLDFTLPPDLIAQSPCPERSAARLLHYRRDSRGISHRSFADLPVLLRPGDLLVFNDSRVLPARFTLRKSSGGLIEGLFLREESPGRWISLLKGVGRHGSDPLHFAEESSITVRIIHRGGGGECGLELSPPIPAAVLLARLGRMPLPPYIRRRKRHDPLDDMDRERYQTVYAREEGSVAAPTAGLHFTPDLLAKLAAAGVERAAVTLHVGLGTFKGVESDRLEDHRMHAERYFVAADAAEAVNRAKAAGRRVIAVGTTACRVLESRPEGPLQAGEGSTGLFIYPPYRWKRVDALITNFHLPRSTLIALVAAFIGLDEQRRVYAEAIARQYRFFSYGDAMFAE